MSQPRMARRYLAHGPAIGSSWAGKWAAMFKNPFLGFLSMIAVVAVIYIVVILPMMALEHGAMGSRRGRFGRHVRPLIPVRVRCSPSGGCLRVSTGGRDAGRSSSTSPATC